jgi:tetratricopeptide (TPR) repeat protein
MLDWSRGLPIYIITLARPDLLERRPDWGAGKRSFSSIYLEPLAEPEMRELLAGLVPGLPDAAVAAIVRRADGIPLYAIEMVRTLVTDGRLKQADGVYVPVGDLTALAVPETLTALISSRLDALDPADRSIVHDAAVMGQTFSIEGLAAVSGGETDELGRRLAGLVRRELLTRQADPRSPEHGQYGFRQDLVRHVAYETISKRERRTRHVAAAAYLESAFAADEDEVVEVIASHYVAALEAVPDAEDASVLREKAYATLQRAGERAESLAAAAEARRYFQRAAELTDEGLEQAMLLARAGEMAARSADPDGARELLDEAVRLYEDGGDTHAAARVSTRIARLDRFTGRLDEGLARLERAFEVIVEDEPDEDLAMVAARLSLSYWSAGDLERAAERAELALDIAEAHGYTQAICIALGAKAAVAHSRGHAHVANALLKQELVIAIEHGFAEEASMSYFVLSDQAFHRDRYAEALSYLDEARAFSQRLGNRPYEWSTLAETTYALFMLGRWDESLAIADELTSEQTRSGGMFLSLLSGPLEIHLQRGELLEAQQVYSLFESLQETTDVQERACYFGASAALRRAEGRMREALDAGRMVLEDAQTLGISHQAVEEGLVEALEAAVALGDRGAADELLSHIEDVPLGRRPPYLDAHAKRFRARLGGDIAEFEAAAATFREIGLPFWLAVTLLELGELTRDEAALAEARGIFEGLKATPWIERVDAATGARTEVPA